MPEYFKVPEEKKTFETENYKVFSEEIDYHINFFECFSELLYSNGMIKSFVTDKNVYLFDTSLIDSSAQTLKSIKLCCSIGSFSDANALIRKFRDDLMLYAYIVSIINQRKPFIEDEFIEFKTEMPKELIESVMDIHFNIELTADEKAVTAWLANNVNDLPYGIKKKLV